jgi:hypothetical protein
VVGAVQVKVKGPLAIEVRELCVISELETRVAVPAVRVPPVAPTFSPMLVRLPSVEATVKLTNKDSPGATVVLGADNVAVVLDAALPWQEQPVVVTPVFPALFADAVEKSPLDRDSARRSNCTVDPI